MLTIDRTIRTRTVVKAEGGTKYELYLAEAPLGLLNLGVGVVPGTEGEPQLVLSTDNLKALKRYENRAATLPSNLTEITQLLGKGSDVVGIRNTDLIALYLNVKRNAGEWKGIENDLGVTILKLIGYGTMMKNIVPKSVEFLEHIMFDFAFGDIDLSSITIEQLHDTAFMEAFFKLFDLDAEVTEQHMEMMKQVNITIDSLIEFSQGYYDDSAALQSKIVSFKKGMMNCRDDVVHKHYILQQQHVSDALKKKRDERITLVINIQSLKIAYDYNQNLRWTAVFGIIGIIIEECVFHKEAKRLDKLINQKIIQLHFLDAEIQQLEKLEAAITSVDTQFQGLEVIFIQAEQGVNQLRYTWGLIVENLKMIRDAGGDLKSAKQIIDIGSGLSQVEAPWVEVVVNSRIVLFQFLGAIINWDDYGLKYTNDYCVSALASGETASRLIPTECNEKRLNYSFDNIRDTKFKLNGNFNTELNALCREVYGYAVNAQEDLKGALHTIESLILNDNEKMP